jgi:hypothetical protein
MNKRIFPIFILCLILIPSLAFAADNYASITMIPGQATNPVDIKAPNGTSYFKVTPNGQVSIGINHKFCLDAGCVTFFQSDGSTISGGSSSFAWSQISKSGAVLNDLGSPTSGYSFSGQPLTNAQINASLNTVTNIADSNVKSGAAIQWSKISKSGAVLNDLGSPTSGYNFANKQLSNVMLSNVTISGADTLSGNPVTINHLKLGGQMNVTGQTLNNLGHVITPPSTSGTLLQNNGSLSSLTGNLNNIGGTFTGTLLSPTFSGNLTVTKSGFPNTEIDAGSGTSGASYTIGVFATTFYAKNGTTQKIEKSGLSSSSVIQYAIDNLPNGGSVLLTKGIFKMAINFTHPGIAIIGQGWGATTVIRDGNNPLFTLYSSSTLHGTQKIAIENLKIDGSGYSGIGTTACINANATSNLVIFNIHETQCYGGNYFQEVWDSVVWLSDFLNSDGNDTTQQSPFYIYSGTRDNSNRITFLDDRFERVGSQAIRSFGTGGSHNNYQINFINPKFEEHQQGGGLSPNYLINFTNTHDSYVDGGYFTGGNKSAIWIDSTSKGIKINDIYTVNANTDCCTPQYSIDVQGPDAKLSGNTFTGFSVSGVNIGPSATNLESTNERFASAGGGAIPSGTTPYSGTLSNLVNKLYGSAEVRANLNVGNFAIPSHGIQLTAGNGTNATDALIDIRSYGTAPIFQGERSQGNLTTPIVISAESNLWTAVGMGYVSGGYSSGGSLNLVSNTGWSSSNHGAFWTFNLVSPNAGTVSKTKLKINGNGDISIPRGSKYCLDGGAGPNSTDDCLSLNYAVSPTTSNGYLIDAGGNLMLNITASLINFNKNPITNPSSINVGGSATASHGFQLTAGTGTNATDNFVDIRSYSIGPTFSGERSQGNFTNPTAISAEANLIILDGFGYVSGGYSAGGSQQLVSNTGWSSSNHGAFWTWNTVPPNAGTALKTTMKLNGNGDLSLLRGQKMCLDGGAGPNSTIDCLGNNYAVSSTASNQYAIYGGGHQGFNASSFMGQIAYASGSTKDLTKDNVTSGTCGPQVFVNGTFKYWCNVAGSMQLEMHRP